MTKPRSTPRIAGAQRIATRPVFTDLALTEHRLRNGLRLLTCVDDSADVVSYMTWLDVGSRHEQPGKTGLAHLFEHLMFAGTERHPHGDFDRLVEEAGAESNAATWVDWTQYYENLPARMLPLAIELESDRLGNLRLEPDVVATEKDVVANERRFRVDDDVDGAAGEALYALAYKRHPYRHPTIGSMRDILAFEPADCEAFRRTHYVPNRVTLVVVGAFDEADLVRRVVAAYGRLRPGPAAPKDPPPEPSQRAPRRKVLRKPSASAKLHLAYRSPSARDPRAAALGVANEVLFGGRSSVVQRALVHDQELATEVSASVSPFRDPGLYEMAFTARSGVSAVRLERALDRVLARVVARGLDAKDVEKAKNRLELAHLHGLETASGKAEQLGFHALVTGDALHADGSLARVRAVTREDATAALRAVLVDRARSVVEVVPEEAAS